MDRKERDERLKRLGKQSKSFSILPLINIVIISLATMGLFLIYKTQDSSYRSEKNQDTENENKKEDKSINKKVDNNPENNISENNLPNKNISENNLPNKNATENNISKNSSTKSNVLESEKNGTYLQIEQKIINLAKQRNLPVDKLSISLIDFSVVTCKLMQEKRQLCFYHKNEKVPRYPASLVKLFWLVIAYYKYPNPDAQFSEQLREMIVNSDNEDSSKVVDKITKTKSSKQKLSKSDFREFKEDRDSLNQQFQNWGHHNINISQKTFPIPYLEMEMPEGADLQLRHPNNEEKPIRNELTSESVARLLYQIYHQKLFYNQQFPQSEEMLSLLKRDLNPSAWQDIPFNSIKGFLGEGLIDKNVDFYSKMGWTFSNRNDAAIVVSPDGKISYILVILGDDPAYYKDVEFLPLVSKMVYEEMSKLSQQ